ncbi:putative effector protein [Blumeria hordei DH14]|uniref:Putative effector protein n=1 Tax=Blumeria graminis f. sp. hordei (strain DH14) TaxID=546991 RepID=N1JB92_BLUG1|nr:putative effector protein [Blumeria hordei DH14]
MATGPTKITRPARQHKAMEKIKIRLQQRLDARNLSIETIDQDKMESEMTERLRVFQEDSNSTNPDVEMGDMVIDQYIIEGLDKSRWNVAQKNDDVVPVTSVIPSTKKIAAPAVKKAVIPEVNKVNQASHAQIASTPPSVATEKQQPSCSESRKQKINGCPPELQAMIEAEERRAAQAAKNIMICTAAINAVETAVSLYSEESNDPFIDSMKIYLRAAIAQFMKSGPSAAPPVLPQRPSCEENKSCPTPKAKERTPMNSQEPIRQVTQAKSTWATVARGSPQMSIAPAKTVRVAPIPAVQVKKQARPATVKPKDVRLFLRLGEEHAWRALSPAGVRDAVTKLVEVPSSNIEHVYRVPTGFAMKAKNEEARQLLLNAAESFSRVEAKVETASDLAALRIATVPVALYTLMGKVTVTEEMVAEEITRTTKAVPVRVRPLGKGRVGAPYQTWIAHFERASAPRPGFRLFDDSGIAVRHQPKQPISQCKRCLQFHGTRGCSRAPACWNCTSTMHSSAECKAHTKCRNCGGPHRSDSRDCLARPTKSGPASKENLEAIRQASQREFAAVVRAKSAVRRAEAAVSAASEKAKIAQTSFKSSNCFEVLMTDSSPSVTKVTEDVNREESL